jgi:uncharacterized protein YkuJ
MCPRLHFMPLGKHVIDRYLTGQKADKNDRITAFERGRNGKQSCLIKYLKNSEIYERKMNEEKESSVHRNVKKERYLIDELKPLENDATTGKIHHDKEIEAISKMQIKFLENTTELIKNYASKMFGVEKGEDEIWTVDADRMKNYRHYFSADNSCNLEQKFDVGSRTCSVEQSQAQQAEMQLFEQAQRECEEARQRSLDEQNSSFCEPIAHKTSLEINFEMSNSSSFKPRKRGLVQS